MSNDDKLIEGHEYDGIQELDNPLPKWWLMTFYATIVFAIGYFAYYQIFDGPTSQEELNADLAEIQSNQPEVSTSTDSSEIDVQALLANSDAMKIGEEAFGQFCIACHGQKGEGTIGPNLTDKYWMHSKGDLTGILVAIRDGFPQKGMPPWGQVIPPEKHAPLAAYVISLKGTNPPNAKAPQGNPIE